MSLVNLQYMLKYAREKTYIAMLISWLNSPMQELIQKENVHINCEKGAQIIILANKLAPQ